MNDYAKRSLADEDLIPCTEELNRLKEFLAEIGMGREIMRHRRRMAEYFDGLPPYSEEELKNTPWTGRGSTA